MVNRMVEVDARLLQAPALAYAKLGSGGAQGNCLCLACVVPCNERSPTVETLQPADGQWAPQLKNVAFRTPVLLFPLFDGQTGVGPSRNQGSVHYLRQSS